MSYLTLEIFHGEVQLVLHVRGEVFQRYHCRDLRVVLEQLAIARAA